MRRLLLAIALIIAGFSPAFAAYDTPKALIEAIYAPYAHPIDQFDWAHYDETPLRDAALNALFAKDKAETPDGMLGRLDFDPYISGQDYEITKFKIGTAVIKGDTATVRVTFHNEGYPIDLTYHLVKEADGWKLDDVTSADKKFPYSLKAIMSGPMPS